ncbi:FapA family protein [Desulfovibrio inopinatus]|uniref:FapA family protein n=1 Tax=Desulfovibrio inopinatus TaxID=102109 RepID=UPI0003FF99B3|nr:FapA family protein [Desulfovibrio inopinatus]
MPYYLKHFFEPNAGGGHIKPKELANGRVDLFDLGYVQNVIVDQLLIEIQPLEKVDKATVDKRFITPKKAFPPHVNCKVNPQNPNQLLAAINGHIYYDDKTLTVKDGVHVKGDVDFHVGNILFVGDVVIDGNVLSGFTVKARNIRVKGCISGATISAMGYIVTDCGIKGAGNGELEAHGNIRAPYAENVLLSAGENILLDGSSMHSDLYAGKKIAIKGRLVGGDIYCKDSVYIGERLGGGIGTTTTIILGYDPLLLRKAMTLQYKIDSLRERYEYFFKQTQKNEEAAVDFENKLSGMKRKLRALQGQQEKLWKQIVPSSDLSSCRLIIHGTLHPGVEVSIGSAYMKVDDFFENVVLRLAGKDIVIEPHQSAK